MRWNFISSLMKSLRFSPCHRTKGTVTSIPPFAQLTSHAFDSSMVLPTVTRSPREVSGNSLSCVSSAPNVTLYRT
jgi:hypothetical protein